MDKSKNDMDNNRTEKRNSVDDLARKDDLFSFLIRGKMTWIRGITRKGVILHISCLFGDADFINNTAVIIGLNGNRLEIAGEKDGGRNVAAIIASEKSKKHSTIPMLTGAKPINLLEAEETAEESSNSTQGLDSFIQDSVSLS